MFGGKFEKRSTPESDSTPRKPAVDTAKAYEEADPTQFSPLPLEKGNLQAVGVANENYSNRTFKDGADTFVEVLVEPERQQVITRLLKGIVPVSDIVRASDGGPDMYSKVFDHSKIEGPDHSRAEVWANLALLSLVFGDVDHSVHFSGQAASPGHNVQHTGGKVSFYDFDNGALGRSSSQKYPVHSRNLEALQLLEAKLDELRNRVSGKAGVSFIAAILENAYPNDAAAIPTPEQFQASFLQILDSVSSDVRDRKTELTAL